MTNNGQEMTTYAGLHTLAEGFATGKANFVILVGEPGLMKTEVVKRACNGRPLLHVRGKMTPLELYRGLYKERDALVVLDDVDPVWKSTDGQVLIRGLTDTSPIKTIGWATSRRVLDGDGNEIPKSYTTTSHVMVIANSLPKGGIFSAIESRGLKFVFKPSWAEVYMAAGEWFRDQEVLDFVHDNLTHMRHPDARLLNQAVEMRTLALPGHDWRDVFNPCMKFDRLDQEIARLLNDTTLTTTEMAAEFVAGGFGDRATFFRRVKKQRAAQAEPIPTRIVVEKSPETQSRELLCLVAKTI